MRNISSSSAAFAATVLLGFISADLSLLHFAYPVAHAAEQPGEFGGGSSLGTSSSGDVPAPSKLSGKSPEQQAKSVLPPDDKAVDRASGLGSDNDKGKANSAVDSGTSQSGDEKLSNKQLRSDEDGNVQLQPESQLSSTSSTNDDFANNNTSKNPVIHFHKPRTPESLGSGAFSESVDITVPAFRGLEPKLALQYSSSGGLGAGGLLAGWIGVGWSLEGLPDIVRTAPINDFPRFDANDVYQLDGRDMIACSAGVTSPSCSTGGTHATKVESYQRIKFDNNIWTVWSKDGIRSVFKPLPVWGTTVETGDDNPTLIKDSYRWLLAERIDTNGNKVTYSYTCLTLPVCYPDTITYGGAEIKFVSITHPSHQTKATGRSLARLERQLKRIEVRFNNQKIRAYNLAHEASPSTNLQRLKQVQEFGKDWTVSGTTVGGSALPAKTFTYSDSSINYIKGAQTLQPALAPSHTWLRTMIDLVGDFNGDGKVDVLSLPGRPYSSYCTGTLNISKNENEFDYIAVKFGVNNEIPCGDYSLSNSSGYVGDFNGDGKSDFVVYDIDLRTASIGIFNRIDDVANFDIYTIQNFVPTVAGRVPDFYKENISYGDFDGNGNVDIFNASNRTIYYFSGGAINSFVVTGGPGTPGGGSDPGNKGWLTTLKGGDRDLLTHSYRSGASVLGSVYYKLVGSSFQQINLHSPRAFSHSLNPATPDTAHYIDINGDGVDDQIFSFDGFVENGDMWRSIYGSIFSGKSSLDVGSVASDAMCEFVWLPFSQVEGTTCTTFVADLNGDGRQDFIVSSESTSHFADRQMFIGRGDGTWQKQFLSLQGGSVANLADLNGDGKPDIVIRSSGGGLVSAAWASGEVWYSTGPIPDLLTSVTLPSGGIVDVEYTPSSAWGLTSGTKMPFVTQTVSAIVEKDGRGGVSRTEYSYRGGVYDYKERKFLGFAGLTAKLPCASGEVAPCPSVDVTFSQAYAAIGKPMQVEHRDGTGALRKTVAETYTIENVVAPYRALNTRTDTTWYGSTPVVLRTDRIYDVYANITEIRDYGRSDVAGDETWTVTSYAPNTTAYIVVHPRESNVRSGGFNTSTDVFEQHQIFYYDGATSDATPPTKGNLTRLQRYKALEPTAISYNELFTYDAYGNKLTHRDGANNQKSWAYDATYNLFVTAEYAPPYYANGTLLANSAFVTLYGYTDHTCGKPTSKTDWNGIVETYTFDMFCRAYGSTNSGTGSFRHTRYENEGNATSQAIVEFDSVAVGSNTNYVRTYYDGLGRSWRIQTPGDVAGGPTRFTDVVYDARGNKAQTSFPYFSNETAQWTVNSYDWNNRIVKTVNPDNTSGSPSQRTYSYVVQTETPPETTNRPVMQTQVTDEEGKSHRTITDKNGNVIVSSGLISGAWVNEFRSYDVLGRLRGVRDPGGAIWTYTYDLMGNRLTASDPDLGNWSYTYDNANRLIGQTDARGAVTTLTYDQMGRLLSKSAKMPGESTATITATNTYDVAEAGVGLDPFHNVGRLTKSANALASHSMSHSQTGNGTALSTKSTINGIVHTTTETKGKTGLTLRITYSPAPVNVGTAETPWTYNMANKLLTIPDHITAATYEADGQTKSITYANGVTTEFTYSSTRRWLTRVLTKKGTTVLMDNQYTRDKLGRIKTITGLATSENWTYSYDDLGRLVTATNSGNASLSETFAYSLTGNLLSQTRIAGSYTYPVGTAVRPHAATTIGTKTLTYDANGNMVSDGSRTLTWDRSNQLASVAQGGLTTSFTYGPDGARTTKATTSGSEINYPNANVEVDRTVPGSEVYTRYPHPDVKIVKTMQAVTTNSWLHRDHLSSIRLVTGAAGTPTEQTTYAAFGEQTNQSMVTKKSYIGERYDAETGLMYLNARYYDPAFGRFVPKDDEAVYIGIGTPDDQSGLDNGNRPPSALWQVRPFKVQRTGSPAPY